MNAFWKKRPGSTVLGLSMERGRIDVVELRRTNGSSEIRRSLSIPIEVDLLTGDIPAVATPLRDHLEQAGIRETHCAVALPSHLASTLTVALPALPDADRQSFLEIEAERGFAQSPDNLFIATSYGESEGGKPFATLVAIDRESVHRIEAILHAAKLKPVAFTLGLTALQSPDTVAHPGETELGLLPTGTQLVLQVVSGKGLASFRVVEDAFLTGEDGTTLHPDLDLILRELRITLGQLPTETRHSLRVARVFGPSDQARAFATTLSSRSEFLGLQVELSPDLRLEGLPFRLPTHPPASSALAVAVLSAAEIKSTLNFLPPRVSAWQQFAQKHASRKLAWAAAATSAAVAVATLCFLGQQFMLWRWQSRWDAIKSRVTQLEGMQREVRRYEPWFDPSVRSLSVLRRLTEAFPEDGSAAAKSIEIRAPSRVTCSGTARDPKAWLRLLDSVRKAPGVSDLQVEQIRGKSPIEFSIHFNWQPSSRS